MKMVFYIILTYTRYKMDDTCTCNLVSCMKHRLTLLIVYGKLCIPLSYQVRRCYRRNIEYELNVTMNRYDRTTLAPPGIEMLTSVQIAV